MNLFKTTLLGVMIAGLACANVSAMNSQEDNPILEAKELSSTTVPAIENLVMKYNTWGNFLVACLSGYGATVTLNLLCEALTLTEGATMNIPGCSINASCLAQGARIVFGIPLSMALVLLTYKFGACSVKKLLKAIEQIDVNYWVQ